MTECSLCKHPKRLYYERQILTQRMTIMEAAQRMSVPYQTLWYHMKSHVGKKPPSKPITDITSILKDLLYKLKKRVDQLLEIPIKAISEREVSTLTRVLKDIAMDIAKLEQQLQESPTVQITNLIVSQTRLQTWLINNLCGECKSKLLPFLKEQKAIVRE